MPIELRLFGNPVGGVRRARSMLDKVVEEQQQDGELRGAMADLWAGSQRRMTRPELEGYTLALQQRANDVRTINEGYKGFATQQQRLRDRATTEEDRAQLETLDTQGSYAQKLMLSSNPELQKMGRELTARLFSDQQAFTTQNEAQRLALEARLGPENWTKYSGLQDNFRQESGGFLDQRSAFGRIKSSLALPPSAASDIALIFNFMKILDPTSVVREGEFATAQNASGVPDILLTAYNKLTRDGERLTPEQRKDFYQQASAAFQQAKGEQLERNTRYLGQARDVGIPDDMLGNFALPTESPGTDPNNFGEPGTVPAGLSPTGRTIPPQDPQTDSTARMIGESAQQGVRTFAGQTLDFLGGLTGIGGGSRETDEYRPPLKAPEEPAPRYNAQGMRRGVYVPPFLRGGK